MLPIKTRSGNRLRHWPAGQQFAWLCSCSPALSCLVPSRSFPNHEGTIQSTACARDHPQQTLGTAATGRPEKTQSQLPWGSHVWISEKNPVLFCPRDILATCFSTTEDCIRYCCFLAYTIFKGFRFVLLSAVGFFSVFCLSCKFLWV